MSKILFHGEEKKNHHSIQKERNNLTNGLETITNSHKETV